MLTQPTNLAPKQSRSADLLDRFRTVRAATMAFCSPLSPEDMMVQSCSEASPRSEERRVGKECLE